MNYYKKTNKIQIFFISLNYFSKKLNLGFLIMGLVILSGCSQMSQGFNSKKSAQEYAIKEIEEKYNTPFKTINGADEIYETYPTKNIYKTKLLSEKNGFETEIWVSNQEELKDNYALSLFEEALIKPVQQQLESSNMFSDTSISLVGGLTAKNLTEDISPEEYFEVTDVSFSIKTNYIESEIKNSELATDINELLLSLYPYEKFNLEIYHEETLIFFYEYSDGKKELSIERIKEMIEEQSEDNSYMDKVFQSFSE